MAVRGSEVSADYVGALRARRYSWSAIARMTGATEYDLRRFHGGVVSDEPVAVKSTHEPLMAGPPNAVLRPIRSKSKAKAKPATRCRRKALTKGENRLVALLVASGLPLQPAIILVRLYRATKQPMSLGEIFGSKVAEAEGLAEMAKAYAAAKPFAISFRRSAKGYKLTNDSRAFLDRLVAVRDGGA